MNKLNKAIIFDGKITLSVLETTDLVNEAIRIHNLTPVTAAALGRTMTITTFMSSNLKNKGDKLSVTVAGDGVGGKITVCGNGDLNMRGTIDNPRADLPLKKDGKLDVGGCVGKHGRLTVVRSMGLKDPYSGSCELVSGEIAEDFTAYYVFSEQQPTAIALGVKIGKDGRCIGAGGVVMQALPGTDDKTLIEAEELINKFRNISSLIEEMGADGVMEKYFTGVKYNQYYPQYKCLCNREYIEEVLISLGKEELNDIIAKEGKIEVDCQFCDKVYEFTKDDVNKFFNK